MKKLSLEEIKELELEMLLYIDKVCRENNIKYFLDSGTLLGAIRHEGFIPWDDDVDIILFREDYEKLLNLLILNNKRYRLLHHKDHAYKYPFAKLTDTKTSIDLKDFEIYDGNLGLFIDIFPIDYLPNTNLYRKYYFNKIWYSRKILNYLTINNDRISDLSLKQKFTYKILNHISPSRINKSIDNICSKQDNSVNQVTTILGSFKKEKILEKDWFKEQIYVNFEDYQFPVPNGYDEYLKKLYGNYMTLPPKKQQVGHDMDIYMK